MNVKSLADKIKKLNENNRWMMLLAAYFISLMASTVDEVESVSTVTKEAISGWDAVVYGISVVISILCCISFYDKYLKISPQYGKDYFYAGGFIDTYMKFHGFSVGEYFLYIMKKFLPVQAVMAAGVIFVSGMEHNMTKAVVGGIGCVMPFLVWRFRKAMFNYTITHRERLWITMVKTIMYQLLSIVVFVLVCMTFMFMVIVAYAVIEGLVVPLNDNLVFISYNNTFLGMLILCVVLWMIILFDDGRIRKKYHIKAIATGIVVLIIAANLFSSMANHTIIEENTITVVKKFKEKRYSFKDVESFEVYEDEKEMSIAMKFSCKDGEIISVVMSNYSSTGKWNERYDNEYAFVKDVVLQLLDKGAKGCILEAEKFVQDMEEELDTEDYKAKEQTLKEIIEILE